MRSATLLRPILRSRWINPPLLVLALLGLVAWMAQADVGGSLRAGLAALLMLFGSGVSLVAALMPRAHGLDRLELLALSGGLALAIGGMLAFVFARLPQGLTVDSLLVGLLVFNLLCYLMTVVRGPRGRATADVVLARAWAGLGETRRLWRAQRPREVRTSIGLLGLLVSGAILLGWSAQRPAPDPPLTEFFLLDPIGLLDNYPEFWPTDAPLTLRYGLANRTGAEARYEIRATGLGRELLRVDVPTLDDGRRAGGTLTLEPAPPDDSGALEKVTFELYRNGQPERSLHLWLTIGSTE